MKQHFEAVVKVHNLKERETKSGWMYTFSVPISENDGEVQITEWLMCSIFLKDKDPRIMNHSGEFHFTGQLKVKKAWGDYPQGLSLFGFEIQPVLGKVYKISKPKHEDAQQASNGHSKVSEQGVSYSDEFSIMSENPQVPF